MPKLDPLIATWRESVRTTSRVEQETLDELENHIRETVDQFVRDGISETEAFRRAVEQLGTPGIISREFQKLDPATWLPVKLGIGTGAAGALALAIFLAGRLEPGLSGFLLALHIFTLTLGYMTTVLVGILGVCFGCQRCLERFSTLRLQSLLKITFRFASLATCLTAAGIALGIVWAKVEWHRFWAWSPKETGALVVLVWLICFSSMHRLRGVTTRGVLLTSVIGNAVVSLAWFGPLVLGNSRTYREPHLMTLMLAIVGLTFGFFLIGLAPACCLRYAKA